MKNLLTIGGLVILGVITAAFWGLFIYAAWTHNWAILIPQINFLGIALGVVIAVSIVVSMAAKLFNVLHQ